MEIRIPTPVILLAVIAAVLAAVIPQLPEIRRYLKIETM